MRQPLSASFLPGEPAAWRHIHLLALVLAVPLLWSSAALMEYRFSSLSLREEVKAFLARAEKRAAQRRRRRVEFILVDPPPDPVREEVKEAELMAAVAQEARDRNPAPAAENEPHSTGEGILKTPSPGTPAPVQKPPRPRRPAPPKKPRPPVPKPSPETPSAAVPEMPAAALPSLRKVEEKENAKAIAASSAAAPTKVPLAPRVPPKPGASAPKETAPKEAAPAKEPAPPLVFTPIGSRASAEAPARKADRASARLQGDMAYRTLLARYPKYMAAVQRRVNRHFQVLCQTHAMSFYRGEVMFQLGIAADGSVINLKKIVGSEKMFSEVEIARSAIRLASPFDPLTETMQKDPLFRNFGFRFIYW